MNEQEALLAQLQDVRTPPVSFWPAPGWWLLVVLVVVLLVAGIAWRRRRRQYYWQYETDLALAAMRSELSATPPAEVLARASELVRQLLLVAEQRSDIAALQGEELLGTLDDICGKPVFSEGPGCLLASGPYQRSPDAPPEELSALLDVIELLKVSVGHRLRKRGHHSPLEITGRAG